MHHKAMQIHISVIFVSLTLTPLTPTVLGLFVYKEKGGLVSSLVALKKKIFLNVTFFLKSMHLKSEILLYEPKTCIIT